MRQKLLVLFIGSLYGCSQHPVSTNSVQQVQRQLAENHPEINLEQPSQQERKAQTDALLNTLVTPQAATQLMLLNSPHLQVELARLGVADAARLQASMISNPRLSLMVLTSNHSGPWQWDLGLTQSLVELLTRSTREKEASSEWIATQLKVTQAFQLNIYQLQQTYFAAIAAKQNLLIQQNLLDAAAAKQQLAESLFNAGNISELDYLAHLNDAQELEREFVHQQEQVVKTQVELNYLLGLSIYQTAELPSDLPPLPPNEKFDAVQLIDEAIHKRIDIQLAKLHQQQLMQQRELIRKEYNLADVNVGVAAKKEADATKSAGPQVELALPLFDHGQAKLAIVNAQLASSDAEIADAQLHAVRDIKQALAQLEHTHRTQLTQAQSTAERRVELAQREINFMLKSPFELIDLKAREIQLKQEQTNALVSYWQARSQLELALGRSIAIETQSDAQSTAHDHQHPSMTPADITTKNDNSEQHKGHKHD